MPYTAKQVRELQTERDLPAYDGQDDATFLADVSALTKTRLNKVTSSDIFEAFVGSELPDADVSLNDATIISWVLSAAANTPVTLDGNISTALQSVFLGGTTTRDNLIALRDESISRLQELGLPSATLGDVGRTV
jgi:hypothetical protein